MDERKYVKSASATGEKQAKISPSSSSGTSKVNNSNDFERHMGVYLVISNSLSSYEIAMFMVFYIYKFCSLVLLSVMFSNPHSYFIHYSLCNDMQ